MIKYIILCVMIFQNICVAEYYSQCGQDKFVNEKLFHNLRNGIFLDIGAHNGIGFSNTYFFERELDWTGICIEPMPEVFEQLIANRSCICIQGCASNEHGVWKDFLRLTGNCEMLSGLIDMYDPAHVQRIQRELRIYGGTSEIIQVCCYNVNILLDEAGIEHVNFLSIDTEGGEFEILKSIDFSKYQIDVIAVEDNYKDSNLRTYLEDKGFVLYKVLDQDLVFVHKNFVIN